MNIKENQYVGSSKWMLMLGLGLLVLLLVIAPAGRHAQEAQVVRAKQSAEVLGLQLAQVYNKVQKSRGPASAEDSEEFKGEGLIGLDPWGQPYKYNVLKTDQGIARVVITSDGPPEGTTVSQNEPSEKIRVVITPGE